MKGVLTLMVAVSALAACATNPANDPVQIKLNDVDTRLGNVERVVSNQSLVDLSRRIDALEAQMRELRGEVEVQQNAAEVGRKSGRDVYADLDKRVSALEGAVRGGAGATEGAAGAAAGGAGAVAAAGAAGAAGGAVAANSASPGDAQSAYNASFEKLKAGNYAAAIAGFQSFMKSYPESDLNDNAQYWIGEAHYVTRDFGHAAQAFRAVGERWPNSRKAPDALLKLGFTQIEQNHLTDARATLKQVIERYPGGDAARLAQERLQRLPPEAH